MLLKVVLHAKDESEGTGSGLPCCLVSADLHSTGKLTLQGTSQLPKGPVDKHHKSGVMFITYSLLIASLKKGNLHSIDEHNHDTSNASDQLPSPEALGVNKESRLAQIVNWLRGRDQRGECLIILDECHKAKNLIAKEGKSFSYCFWTFDAA